MTGPAADANLARNRRRRGERRERWTPARDALWDLLSDRVAGRVAVVGAGNGDSVPLGRIAAGCDALTLLDLDVRAGRGARRRLPREARDRVAVRECDVTGGAADRIIAAAGRDHLSRTPLAPEEPLPGGPYDLVVGDLLYSQLLYPALLDRRASDAAMRATLRGHGAALTRSVVVRMHASAPVVVHVHDPVGWWAGHAQPIPIEDVLAAPDPLAAAARCDGPREADPRTALAALKLSIAETRVWRWPFTTGVDYLACGTVARSRPPSVTG